MHECTYTHTKAKQFKSCFMKALIVLVVGPGSISLSTVCYLVMPCQFELLQMVVLKMNILKGLQENLLSQAWKTGLH